MSDSPRLEVLFGIGETIRGLRAARGWTQDQLQEATREGRASGVSATAIGRIERGQDLPNISTLDRLLKALDVSFGSFLAMWRQVRGESVEASGEGGEPVGAGEEVFLVWRVTGGSEREPKEVQRQVKNLVQLARQVRASLREEVGDSGNSEEADTKGRRRP